MREKILIIGSNSFSGAHFADHCLSEGLQVAGISRSKEYDRVFLPYKKNPQYNHNFLFHQLDLNGQLAEIINVIRDFKPDYVVNFAAQGMVAQSWDNPRQWLMTNTISAVELHDQLRQCSFLKKFVQISTPEVYGNCHGLVQESCDYHPSTPYAVSKAAADMSLMTFYHNYGFPVCFTRAANVYGPHQQLYRIVPITILKFLTGGRLQLHGGGHSIRSFIHIRDVADATLKIARNASPGSIFHLSTSRNISIRDLVRLIAERLDVDFEQHVEVVEDRPGKDAAYLLDSSRARKELKWQDRFSLEDGIDETIEWIKDNFDILKKLNWKYQHKE